MKYSAPSGGKAGSAYGRALPISLKKAIEVSNFIRGNRLGAARKKLENVIEQREPVPYRRFAKGGTGHRKGIGPGRYPVSTCREMLKILKAAEANAQQNGLDASKLYVSSIVPKKAPTTWHYGRKRRRKMKLAHLELTVMEMEEKKGESKND